MKTLLTRQIANLNGFFAFIFNAITPRGKAERGLFIILFAFYGVFGLTLALNSNLLDAATGNAGSYLGYDNLYHLKTRGGGLLDISHPLLNAFHFVKYLVTAPLSWMDAKGPVVFLVLLTNFLVTSTMLVLYKYLLEVVSLTAFRSWMLTLFCSVFFTTIVLSFTVETYPVSFLLLMLSLYMLSLEYRRRNKFGVCTVLLFEFICGSVTITNAVKPLSAIFLSREKFSGRLTKALKLFLPFAGLIAGIFLFYLLIDTVKGRDSGGHTSLSAALALSDYLYFDKGILKNIFIDYWGNSLLIADLSPQTVYEETVLRPGNYTGFLPYFLIFPLLVLFVLSFILNRKQVLVKLIILYASVDILIHFVLRYGLNEAILFGGHWLFLVPISLGWLYRWISKRNVSSLVLDVYIIFCTVAFAYNNVREIYVSFIF
ncbi:MAG: DUF6080 domain-containing protein [Dysgonamonadaceae bacterium]|jgi:hypothetical protein|nr:DUF6080 domain-containing protein [Dysgonamonadaceae bacterium]